MSEDTPADPPFDLAAEQGILGALIRAHDPTRFLRIIATGIESRHFYRPAHGALYGHILGMFGRDEPVDVITVRSSLDTHGWPRGLGPLYLSDLVSVDVTPSVDHAVGYADTVLKRAQQREGVEVLDGARQDLAKPGADVKKIIARLLEKLAAVETTAASGPEWAGRLRSGGAFILDAPPSPPAVWGEGNEVMWAEGEALLIAGPPGVGKTTIVGQLVAGRLGVGPAQTLGLPVQPGAGRVLYLAMDRPPQIARALARLFGPEMRAALDDRLVIWPGPPPGDFAQHPDLLQTMCEQAGADTVIVDSLKDCVRKLSDDESGSGYNTARQRALAGGVQVVELHHQRKASAENRKPSKLDDVYGSVWLTAGAGSVVLLWGEAGDPVVELSHIKQPAEPVGPWRIVHDHTAGTSSVEDRADLTAMAQEWNPGGEVDALTPKDAAARMFDTVKPTRSEIEKARRKLDSLVRQGRLVRIEGAKGGVGGGESTRYFRPGVPAVVA